MKQLFTVFLQKAVLKNLTKIRGKLLCRILYFNTVASRRPPTFSKGTPVNNVLVKFAKFFEKVCLQSNCEQLSLNMSYVKINRKPCRFRLVQTKTSYVTARCFKMKSNFNGNAQFLFLCNPQKSSVNAVLMKIIKKHCHTRK